MQQHRYPEMMIAPMRADLARLGVEELRTPEDVDAFLAGAGDGTALLIVNSICGCAAGSMRPGLEGALPRVRPDRMGSVFAGADLDATARARELFEPYPPSSPCIGVFSGGALVTMIERGHLKGTPPEQVTELVVQALEAAAPA
ncbi:MAG: BrxA/BrxB family bacilliredoxin [Gemmatimonadota bacterium]